MDGQTDVRRTLHGGKGRAVQSVARVKSITLHGLAHSKLTRGLSSLSLTTKGSCMRFAKSLVSHLTPLPRIKTKEKHKWLRVEYTNGDGKEKND